jgi:hypothetical protein
LLNLILAAQSEVAGDMTALAVTPLGESGADDYLVNVSELGARVPTCAELIDRARVALKRPPKENINHNILMTSCINDNDMTVLAQCIGNNIHVAGNFDDVRFIVVVSDVPDRNKPDDPPAAYEGRFRLDKSRLKEAFLGRTDHRSSFGIRSEADWKRDLVRAVPVPAELDQPVFRSTAIQLNSEQKEEENTDDDVISRGQVAREFFGYKGLPDLDED